MSVQRTRLKLVDEIGIDSIVTLLLGIDGENFKISCKHYYFYMNIAIGYT
jgi:hypothetical protein